MMRYANWPLCLSVLLASNSLSAAPFAESTPQASPWSVLTREAHEAKIEQVQRLYRERYEAATRMANRNGWPKLIQRPDGSKAMLVMLDITGNPLYVTNNNGDAAATTSTDRVQPHTLLGIDLRGAGEVIGLWEPDEVYVAHPEFSDPDNSLQSRVIQVTTHEGVEGHPIHVAGTLIAAGGNFNLQGMDPAADPRGMAPEASVRAYA